jgi:hypothetical protein
MSKLVFNEETYEIVRLGRDITGIYQCLFKHNDKFVKGVEITEELVDDSYGTLLVYKVYNDGEYVFNYFCNGSDITIRDMVDIIQDMKNNKLIKTK